MNPWPSENETFAIHEAAESGWRKAQKARLAASVCDTALRVPIDGIDAD
jgi:hypothetical protein